MSFIQHRRLLIATLVFATVLVNLAVVVVMQAMDSSGSVLFAPKFAGLLLLSLQRSQIALMAIWLGIGRTSGPVRFVGTLGVIVAWCGILASLNYSSEIKVWFGYAAIQMLLIAVPLLLIRATGRLEIQAESQVDKDAAVDRNPYQFSIGYLLAWTTAFALMLATLKSVAPFEDVANEIRNTWHDGGNFVYAINAVVVLWVVLGSGTYVAARYVGYGVLLFVLPPALFAVRGSQDPGPDPGRFALSALWLLGSLTVVRLAGYRVRFGRRGGQSDKQEDE